MFVLSHNDSIAVICAVTALASVAGSGKASAGPCAPASADPVDAVRRMYTGAMAGDRARTIATYEPDAYLFDGGARFTPEGITDFILKAEATGVTPRWSIDGAESHATCDLAWATWTNRGTFTTSKGVEPKVFLESAVLAWRDGAWRIRFFHSTPVNPAR
jgi:hypothetical protein